MENDPEFKNLFALAAAGPAAVRAFGSIGDDAAIDPAPFAPPPDRYVVRDIGYEIDDSGSLQFLFRNPGLALPLPPGGIATVIQLLGSQPLAASVDNFLSIVSTRGQETPLDINLQDTPAYIIFRLPRHGNLYFAPDAAALTHKDAADVGYCAELMHVGTFGSNPAPVEGCKLIYFMARPKMTGVPPQTDEYTHSLNIKTRLLQKPHFGSPLPRILDIVIDPDVRHPGGSPT